MLERGIRAKHAQAVEAAENALRTVSRSDTKHPLQEFTKKLDVRKAFHWQDIAVACQVMTDGRIRMMIRQKNPRRLGEFDTPEVDVYVDDELVYSRGGERRAWIEDARDLGVVFGTDALHQLGVEAKEDFGDTHVLAWLVDLTEEDLEVIAERLSYRLRQFALEHLLPSIVHEARAEAEATPVRDPRTDPNWHDLDEDTKSELMRDYEAARHGR